MLDDSGGLLATGTSTGNATQVISSFAPTTGGTFYVAVLGASSAYGLVVTRDADFDTESNNTLAPDAQDITLSGTALGSLLSGDSAPGKSFGLIQDVLPWSKNSNTTVAAELGYTVTLVPSSALASTDLSVFDVLVLAGDQNTSTYSNVVANFSHIESYVAGGGVWLVNYVEGGSSVYSYDVLPDADGVAFSYSSTSDINVLDPQSALITGPGGTITDSNLDGYNSSAHGYTLSALPSGANAILSTGLSSQVVAFDYPFAAGHVIVHTVPVEYYDGSSGGIGQIFHRNLFNFAAGFGVEVGDYYSVETITGDVLNIATSVPAEGPGEFVNSLDLAIELYDPAGSLVASDATGTLTHTTAMGGSYTVRVLSEANTRGEYVLTISGHTGALAPFEVTSSTPADGTHFLTAPAVLTIDLSDVVLASSVQATDLMVNGVAASAVTIVDADTLEFTLPAAVEGPNNAVIAGGALADLQGQPLEPFSVTYDLDLTPPRVIASSVLEGDPISGSTLVYTAQFDDPLYTANLDASDVQLVGQYTGSYTPASFNYDIGTSTLTVEYSGLSEDQYTLTLLSGVGRFADQFDRALDGEPDATTTVPSGDGVAGGDFVVHFIRDDLTPLLFPVPLSPIEPLGSVVYKGGLSDAIQFAGDRDDFSLQLEEDQKVSIIVEGLGGLTPQVTLHTPGLPLVATAVAPGPNGAAVLQGIPTYISGDFTVSVEGVDGTWGDYSVTVLLNAVPEMEGFDGSDNSLQPDAQDLDTVFQDRGTLGAEIAALLGQGDIAFGPTYSDSQTQSGLVYYPNVLNYDFTSVPTPLGDAVLTVTTLADLGATSEYLTLNAEGLLSHDLFVTGGGEMSVGTTQVTIPLATLTQLASDGTISFTVTPSSAVDNLGSTYLTLNLEYVTGVPSGGDWYQFSLEDGETASLALDAAAGTVLELVDSAGNQIASGIETVNLTQAISSFADQTSDGLPETYFVHVSVGSGPYNLVVTRNSDFDTEANQDFANAQDIGGTLGVSGHIIASPPASVPGETPAALVAGEDEPLPETDLPPIQTVYFQVSEEGDDPYSAGDLPAALEVDPATTALTTETLSGPIPILQTFAGPGYSNGVPPDPTLAVGPEQVVTIVNTSIAVYDKSTGSELYLQSLNGGGGFFGSTGATTTIFDPWVLYDTESDRFFAIAIDLPSSSSSYLYIAVSTDSTPTSVDDWHKYRIPFTDTPSGALGSGVHFADYPKLGVNDDAIWVSGNYFPILSGSGVYAGITAIEKDALLNGSAVNILYQEFFDGFSVMPMTQYDSGSTQYFAESSTGSGSSIRIHAVSDVLTSPTRSTTTVSVPSFQAPYDVPQLGGATPADSIDARIMTGVWRDGSMWFAHAIMDPAVDTEAVVRWYEVSTNNFPASGTPTLVQNGNVDPGSGLHTWMPAVAVDGSGNLGVGFSLGGPARHLGAGFTGRLANDPAGSVVLPVTEFATGLGSYEIIGSSGRNRWGDYSGLAIDPTNEGTFWVFNEYATAVNTWATQIASFQLQQPVDEDWYQFGVNAGDILRLQTYTPGGDVGQPENLLDVSIELIDPIGNVIPYTNQVGNELLFHVAQETGQYRVRVFSETTDGEYYLQVEGATGGNLPPTVVDTDPDVGSKLNAFPTNYTLTLSEATLPSSWQASDLLLGGLPATALNVIDAKTLEFTIDPSANLGSGVYEVVLAADSILDLQGNGNIEFITTFEVDVTPPVIVDTYWNGQPLKISRLYNEGPLTFEALFNEDLFLAGSARRGTFTPGTDDVYATNIWTGSIVYPLTVNYDPSTDLVTAEFDALPEGEYTLTIRSGSGAVEDQVGNDLDGEPLGSDLDGTTTGDGVAGGDYSVDFFVDRTTPISLEPFVSLEPLGGLVARSANNTGFLNMAGDQEVFEFVFEAGQMLSAMLHPTDPLATLSLQVLGVTPIFTATAPGQAVVLPLTQLPATGLYELRVNGDAKSAFSLDVFINAAAEPGSDTADGQELAMDNSLLDLGSGRYAVVGRSLASPSDSDEYTLDLSGKAGQRLDVVLAGLDGADFSSQLLELLDDAGNVLATASADPLGTGNNATNFDLAITDFVVPDVGSNIYTLRLYSTVTGEYGLVVTEDLVFDSEPNQDSAAPLRDLDQTAAALGYLTTETVPTAGLIEPDDYASGTVLNDVVPGVSLSVNGSTTHDVTSAATSYAPTGLHAFGSTYSGSTWSSNAQLYATFAVPTNEVSITVGSDDSSDISFLSAYDSSGELLATINSAALGTGQTQVLTITRDTNDIASIRSGGVGGDAVFLDHLEFNTETNQAGDSYLISLLAGQSVTLFTETPLDGPLALPENTLDPLLTLYDSADQELATDANSHDGKNAELTFTATIAGDYIVRVDQESGEGAYVLRVVKGLPPADFDEDFDVDVSDLMLWQRGFNIQSPNAVLSDGDADGDQDVDSDDLALWAAQFGTSTPVPAVISILDAEDSQDVDGDDLALWSSQFSTTTLAPAVQTASLGQELITSTGHSAQQSSESVITDANLVDAALADALFRTAPVSGTLTAVRGKTIAEYREDSLWDDYGFAPLLPRVLPSASAEANLSADDASDDLWDAGELADLAFESAFGQKVFNRVRMRSFRTPMDLLDRA